MIPPFPKSGGKLSASELYKTKIIAKARIHVERFNERLKNYKILQGVIPANLFPLTTQIIFVCSNLVNFGPLYARNKDMNGILWLKNIYLHNWISSNALPKKETEKCQVLKGGS